MELVELHDHPEYINACCEILNNQWKRSHAARYRSLSKSSSDLPVSLALIRHREGLDGQVIGHAKLCRVLHNDEACFVESVLVIPEERGKGFGKLVMKLTEDYARKLHEVLPVNTRQGTLLRGYWIHELPSCLWDFRHRGPHGTVCQALRRQTKRTTYQRQIVRRQPFTKSRLLRAVGTAATAATSSPATAAFITAESECDRSGVDDETAVKKYFGRSSELCYVKGVRDQFQCILFSGTSEASLKRIYMRQ
ncbi:uncharacterized protein LOC119401493 isoform X1 [Rhipicephalus sanguineus]|uniref:uncharacterized protein LOC119401493 isoform X1 n=1 Tax=Rhipicephalus sanguineus TaxID=34632 RepID=UPI0018931DB8|nr:uncharacterized protein LOC119401493 isoform X1 [Rhipicephalus sanguineus]